MNPSVDIKNKLLQYLKELSLLDIQKNYFSYAEKARAEVMSYEEYLYELIEYQYYCKRNRRIENLIKESKLPLDKNMETFELQRLPPKVIQQVKLLLDGGFLDHKENILAFGNPGGGKTHLLCAIGHELIKKHCRRIYFTTCSFLVQELLKAKKALTLSKYIKKLSRYEGLIIDDIGYVQQDRAEMEVLFTLLAERYERGSVMITSNLPFSKWENIFKDPMTTAAAIDRLVHHSVILELNLTSYRMSEAKKRKGGDK